MKTATPVQTQVLNRICKINTPKIEVGASSAKTIWGNVGYNAFNDMFPNEHIRNSCLAQMVDARVIAHGTRDKTVTLAG